MRRIVLPLTVFIAIAFALPTPAATAAEELEAIQNLELDSQQCYRVRDVFLEREDVKFYFIDGYVIFAKPLNGRTLAALFMALDPADEGEILLIPPSPRERQSLVRFTSEPVLNQKFRTAMMFFTDDTAEELRASIDDSGSSRLDPVAGDDLARKWSYPMHNVLDGLSFRVLIDSFSNFPPEHGFFAAAIAGGTEGRFDVVIDPRTREQVTLGQSVWRERRRFYEVWSRFAGRRFRSGEREPVPHLGRLENYRIEAHLGSDLEMRVVTSADFVTEGSTERLFAFELSRKLRVQRVSVDAKEVEFIQYGESRSGDGVRHDGNLIAVALPDEIQSVPRHRIEFHYEGKVVNDAGNGVYYVGSRASWYPRRENPFSHFELTFHHPEELDLVATGTPLETSASDGMRTSIFKTESPIRLAGFNLGSYARAHRDIGEYRIEVCANRKVEESLRPKSKLPMIWSPPITGPGRSRQRPPNTPTIVTGSAREQMPSPIARLEYVASDSAAAFSFFLDRFGPPATSKIVISPIPGGIGQGFPGLVYASTLSYFRPDDPPLAGRPAEERLFYSQLLRSHEISHQWWGNVVAPEDTEDEWLMEALATYSSLLFLEKRQGRAALDRALAMYKADLLTRDVEGKTVENAGAIVLGERLRSSSAPEASRIIVYEKGAWIMHMLRGVMGDASFFRFLKSLCEEFRFMPISTEEFRRQAVRFVPKGTPDRGLREFFDQWVYGTGIPTLTLDYDITSTGREFLVTGRLGQSGVPESSSLLVAIETHAVDGPQHQQVIATDGNVTEFTFKVAKEPTQIRLDPQRLILMNQ